MSDRKVLAALLKQHGLEWTLREICNVLDTSTQDMKNLGQQNSADHLDRWAVEVMNLADRIQRRVEDL